MPDVHPRSAPCLSATLYRPDGALYDAVEGQWRCVQRADNTCYCLHNWYSGADGYAGIVPGSGYAGFQFCRGKGIAILSLWNTDRGRPAVEYAKSGAVVEPFGGEGSGVHVLTDYPWRIGVWYTMRIQARTVGRRTVYEQWVKAADGGWEKLAAIAYPAPKLGFSWDCFFLEDWLGGNAMRGCQLRGYYARRALFGRWRSLDGYEISNHLPENGAQNVRFDCDFKSLNADAVYLRSGGDGFNATAPALPATLRVKQDGKPRETGYLD